MKRGRLHFLALLIGVLAAIARPLWAERPVTVFAAASLGGVLEEIAASYAEEVVFSYGGSGAMARQVAARAPADLVVLANPRWMDWLRDQGVPGAASSQLVAGNHLVVIGQSNAQPIDNIKDFPDMLRGARLAMGHREAVPAGAYARQWLEMAGLWPRLAPQLAETENVRAALALVARGDAPFGIVYASDAQAEPRVQVLYRIPASAHDPILYPAAALTPEGAAFLAHLSTPAALSIFAAHGFLKVAP